MVIYFLLPSIELCPPPFGYLSSGHLVYMGLVLLGIQIGVTLSTFIHIYKLYLSNHIPIFAYFLSIVPLLHGICSVSSILANRSCGLEAIVLLVPSIFYLLCPIFVFSIRRCAIWFGVIDGILDFSLGSLFKRLIRFLAYLLLFLIFTSVKKWFHHLFLFSSVNNFINFSPSSIVSSSNRLVSYLSVNCSSVSTNLGVNSVTP